MRLSSPAAPCLPRRGAVRQPFGCSRHWRAARGSRRQAWHRSSVGRGSCAKALARSTPACTRSRIMPRSNSANTPSIWKSARPDGVVVLRISCRAATAIPRRDFEHGGAPSEPGAAERASSTSPVTVDGRDRGGLAELASHTRLRDAIGFRNRDRERPSNQPRFRRRVSWRPASRWNLGRRGASLSVARVRTAASPAARQPHDCRAARLRAVGNGLPALPSPRCEGCRQARLLLPARSATRSRRSSSRGCSAGSEPIGSGDLFRRAGHQRACRREVLLGKHSERELKRSPQPACQSAPHRR